MCYKHIYLMDEICEIELQVYLRYIEHLSVKDSTAGKYSQDEFKELQRQNNKLCDIVSEMKKELKELKGEV